MKFKHTKEPSECQPLLLLYDCGKNPRARVGINHSVTGMPHRLDEREIGALWHSTFIGH